MASPRALFAVLAVIAGASACSSSGNRAGSGSSAGSGGNNSNGSGSSTGGSGGTGSSDTVDRYGGCHSDADCATDCTATESCCETAASRAHCNVAMLARTAAKNRADYEAMCRTKDVTCDERLVQPTSLVYVARCHTPPNGKGPSICIAVGMTPCSSDADCAIACAEEDDCCEHPNCETAQHVDDTRRIALFNKSACNGHTNNCDAPRAKPNDAIDAKCVDRMCTAVKRPKAP